MEKSVILCVDDEKIILRSLKDQLRRPFGERYSIETAESGDEALDIFEELQQANIDIPLVIADQIMPGIKGDELLKRIYVQSPHTVNILLTGQANADAVGSAVNYANLFRYLAKPWEQADLILTVREALRRYFREKALHEQYESLQQMYHELEEHTSFERQLKERASVLEARETELQKKYEVLQELNASKDKFVSIISHDIKNPLNTLLLMTEVLVEDFEDHSAEEIKSYLKRLHTSSKQLHALLDNLLKWAQIRQGAVQCVPERTDIHLIAEGTLKFFALRAADKQIVLKNEIGADTFAYADYWMITTVIRNLISNALKFCRPGDTIELAEQLKENHVEIAVSDSGIGMSEKDMSKLFRLDSKHTTVGTAGERGTGLGLILCQELVEQNGGEIWVESSLDKGSTFRFTLPRYSSEE